MTRIGMSLNSVQGGLTLRRSQWILRLYASFHV